MAIFTDGLISFDVFIDICRLCGNKQQDNINMFETEGRKISLAYKIRTKIDIDVTLDDPLPKVVCRECCKRLECLIQFQDTCLKIQDKLMNDYLATVETPTADEDDNDHEPSVHLDLSPHMLDDFIEDNDDDQLGFATEIEIYADGTKHMMSISPTPVSRQRSDILSLSLSEAYDEAADLTGVSERIVVVNSSNTLSSRPEGADTTTIPTYVVVRRNGDGPITLVPVPKFQTATLPLNVPPNKVAIPRLTKDNKCDPIVYTLPPGEGCKEEEQGEVAPKRKKTRKSPTKIFRVPRSKQVRRLVQKLSNTEYRCALCGACFPRNYLCEYHVRCHTGEMPFQCATCGKSFVAMHMLKKHNQSHEPGHRHRCPTCARGFRNPDNLREHEKMHRDVPPPFRCETCGKGFYFRASFNGHLETHGTKRSHACDRCSKNYKSARHLKEHVARVHEGVTRHRCPTCAKCFFRRTNFRQHLRLHTTERPYVCGICGRPFNDRTNLVRHIKIHDRKKACRTDPPEDEELSEKACHTDPPEDEELSEAPDDTEVT